MKLKVYNHVTEAMQTYVVDDMDDLRILCESQHFREPSATSFPEALYELADDLSRHHMDAYVEESESGEREHAIDAADALDIVMAFMDESGALERASQNEHLQEQGEDLPPIGHVTHAEVDDGDAR